MCTIDFDIMGIRGTYHAARVLELVEKFKAWRSERIPGVRAFQSTYDRCHRPFSPTAELRSSIPQGWCCCLQVAFPDSS
jgi:hypothetical protein